MTLANLATRGRAMARSWWAPPALVLLLALWVAWRLNAGRGAALEAARLAEEARARAAGQLVVEQARGRDLEAQARRLAGANEDLAQELARARAALPGARVTGTASSSTGARPAGAAPRPGPVAYRCETEPARAPADVPGPPAGAAPTPACLLAAGDEGEIRVDQVVLDGHAGAQLVVGAASAWRVAPEPRTKLFGGPFRADLSRAQAEAPEAVPGWGAGVVALAGRSGWAVGPALSPPPRALWGLRLELLGGAAVGPGGEWSAAAAMVARW